MLGLSCKEGEDLTGVSVSVDAAFLAAAPPPGVTDHVVSLEADRVREGRVTLAVVVTDVSELASGIALKLTYPDQISKFVGCSDGDVFQSGSCLFAEPAPGSGEVFVGRSLLAPEAPAPIAGSSAIVRIDFLVFGKGSGPIVFEAQNLGGGDASALLDENGDPILMTWVAGDLEGS
jgi:hypothetical protein